MMSSLALHITIHPQMPTTTLIEMSRNPSSQVGLASGLFWDSFILHYTTAGQPAPLTARPTFAHPPGNGQTSAHTPELSCVSCRVAVRLVTARIIARADICTRQLFRHLHGRTFTYIQIYITSTSSRDRAAPGLRGACIAPPGSVDSSGAKVVRASRRASHDRDSRGSLAVSLRVLSTAGENKSQVGHLDRTARQARDARRSDGWTCVMWLATTTRGSSSGNL